VGALLIHRLLCTKQWELCCTAVLPECFLCTFIMCCNMHYLFCVSEKHSMHI
jgi:hypothetical protein